MSLTYAATIADIVARSIALAGAAFAGVVALTHWAVRSKKLPPFGAVSRTMRSISDPFLRPIERTLVRRGSSPQDATLWLLGIAVVVGLILVMLVRWVFASIDAIAALEGASPKVIASTVISTIIWIITTAIFIRVIASWFRASQFSRLMRVVEGLTDWLIKPIRRLIPPVGGVVDLSPIIAYFALVLLRSFILTILIG